MEIISLISAVVGIITLIVFFGMAGNISVLRKELQNKSYRDALIEYYTYRDLGVEHYGLAGSALLKAYYSKMVVSESEWSREITHNQLKHDLESLFTAINYHFPVFKKVS